MTDERKQRNWQRNSTHSYYESAEGEVAELRKQGYVLNQRAEDSDKAVKIRKRPSGSYDVMVSNARPS